MPLDEHLIVQIQFWTLRIDDQDDDQVSVCDSEGDEALLEGRLHL